MKIAHVVCTFPPYKGGIGNVAYEFSKLSQKNKHSVTVFTPNYNNTSSKLFLEGVNIVRLKPILKYGNGAFLHQLLFNKLNKFDIVHLHYPFFGGAEPVWLIKTLNKKSFKLIVHYHMDVKNISTAANFLSIPSNLIFNSLFKKADAITCASIKYIANSKLSNFYKENKEKFYEIPFGVDINKFFPLEKKMIGSQVKLLFVGGLDKAHYFKGVDILLKAVSLIDKDKWSLNIVGNGGLKQKYIENAKKLGILENIKFLSGVDNNELAKIYRNSDLFILPSINQNEAFGIVLLEAMASGLSVIASDLPGVNSVFNEGEQGFFIKPNDVEDLKVKIASFINNKEDILQKGKNSRKLTLEKYDFAKIGVKLDNIYRALLFLT